MGQVRQAARLELARVAQQRTGGADSRPVLRADAQAIERGDAVGPHQILARELRVELPGFAHGYGGAGRRNRHRCRQYHLARLIAGDCRVELSGRHHFEDQLPGGDVQGCEPRGRAAGINRYHIVVAVLDQPIISQHGAGRDRLDHSSADDAFGQLGIFDLLTDCDPMPLGDETPEVFGRGLHGNARERHLGSTAVIA